MFALWRLHHTYTPFRTLKGYGLFNPRQSRQTRPESMDPPREKSPAFPHIECSSGVDRWAVIGFWQKARPALPEVRQPVDRLNSQSIA